eukprot:TCALIF_10280-PA protein Name:"Similar to Kcnb1 Potassium voltage-gated channel subfamily B member 1 (Rattus norvegicus)" AED:0.14 eAED:0.14 QI:442/0.5/0.6/0.8/0.25/0.4/5/0/478
MDNKDKEECQPLNPKSDNNMASTVSTSKDTSDGGKVVILNVGGQRHEALKKNFDKFPQSRLWRIMRANSVDEILHFCDRYRVTHINDEVPEYFFDHNYTGFIAILDAYRTGHLHLNANNCAIITKEDMNYWGIDELLIEPCCAVKYYPEIEVCQSEIDMEEDEKQKAIDREKLEDFGPSKLGRLRKFLWDLFEYPQTSRGAQFVACFSLLMILVSTGCFILSTNPDFDIVDKPSKEELESEEHQRNTVATVILWVDAFTAVYFTIEYFVRLACTPKKLQFFIQPMNLVDLFAILPYFINFIVDHLSEFHIIGKAGKVVRLVRVTKILRVFKLVRHFAGLQSMFFTIRQAARELGLLVLLIGVSVLTFSSLVYFAEKDDSTNNWSFMDSFWWGLLTITTVGNGTDRPDTGAGKFVGSMCAVFGIFTMILPIPIVVNSFAAFYRNRLWRNEVALKRRDRIANGQQGKDGGIIELNGYYNT